MGIARDTVGDVVSAAEAAVGLSRSARLRRQIRDTADLWEKLPDAAAFDDARGDLERVVTVSARSLRSKVDPDFVRKWNYASPFVGVFLAGIASIPAWLVWGSRDTTWAKIVIGVFLFFALLLFVVSIATMTEKVPVGEEDGSD